jgi:hypothetical protein
MAERTTHVCIAKERTPRFQAPKTKINKTIKARTHGQNGGSAFFIGSATPQWMHFVTSEARTFLQILHDLAVTSGGAIAYSPLMPDGALEIPLPEHIN